VIKAPGHRRLAAVKHVYSGAVFLVRKAERSSHVNKSREAVAVGRWAPSLRTATLLLPVDASIRKLNYLSGAPALNHKQCIISRLCRWFLCAEHTRKVAFRCDTSLIGSFCAFVDELRRQRSLASRTSLVFTQDASLFPVSHPTQQNRY
jgi:hypothetical protein